MMATVIKNTTIVTGGPGRTILHDSAIAIEDGKIAALGNSEELGARFPRAEVVDGRRKAVFPGLINAHTHLLKTANRGILEDTGFPTTLRFPEDTRALMGKEEENVFAVLGVIESIRSGTTCVLEIEKDIANYAQTLADTGMRMALAEYVEDVDMESVRRSEYSYIPAKADEGMRKSVDLIEGCNGGAEGRVTCMTSPSTPEYCSPELLQECRQTADRYDIGMTVHLSESYDEVQAVMRTRGVRPTQYLYVNGALGPRVVAAHCRYLDDSEIALMGQTRTNVSFNPAIAARRGAAAPAAELEEAGSNIGMGSDNMDENMLHVLRTGLFAERVRRHTPMSPQRSRYWSGGLWGVPVPGARAPDRQPGGREEGRPVYDRHFQASPGAEPPDCVGVHTQRAGGRRGSRDGRWTMADEGREAVDHRRGRHRGAGREDGTSTMAPLAGQESLGGVSLLVAASVAPSDSS